MKKCSRCQEPKASTEFYRSARAGDGLQSMCKTCHYARIKRWRKDNPERQRAIQRGCYRRHHLKERARGKARHEAMPEYVCWKQMNARCHSPKHRQYPAWGGRGIRVCDEWRGPGGFKRFRAYIGPRPSCAHSIDRIDNNLGYAPGNVRWATPLEQARNTRRVRLLTIGNETHCVEEWAQRVGLNGSTIRRRLRAGWSPEDALTAPIGARRAA
jgi:hypothetical protein